MGQADAARVVRGLGMFQRAGLQGDGPRLFALRVARRGRAAATAWTAATVRQRIADLVGRPAQGRGRADGLALEQQCLGQRAANNQLVLPLYAARLRAAG